MDEHQLRIDLAAAFRCFARLGMHEAVANHFSAAVSPDGRKFLMNRKWQHFFANQGERPAAAGRRRRAKRWLDAPTSTLPLGRFMGRFTGSAPHVRVALHLHPVYATAIACLKDPQIKPVEQNTARYFNRVALDTAFGGMADTAAEGARLVEALGDKSRLMMGNHGVLGHRIDRRRGIRRHVHA